MIKCSYNSPTDSEEEPDFSIVAKIIDEDGINDVVLNYRQGGSINFTTLLFSVKGDSFEVTIPKDVVSSRGVEYFITATDIFRTSTREPVSEVYSIQVSVPTPGVKKETEQPSGSEQNAYRLISVPLDLDDKSAKAVLEDNLGQYNKKKWRLFSLRPDPSESQPYAEYPDTLKMDPGKAFLLIVKDPGKLIDTGAGKSYRTDKPFAIPLHPRWNFAGNPFYFSIPLENLRGHLKSGNLVNKNLLDFFMFVARLNKHEKKTIPH